ncbi:triggering receptor expressed on myeloid cells 2-like [Rhinatrema bivittatum]|uniref:triggering receptor expressed on myeloid cells 2-like n=1 Tax=Rhinatrema bivittatum TaxID=194408 RepID=UPI00112DB2CB|nr:triggering receptor expressed on myeloid cells 2-like [Rhinatrema bivittatum]
MGSAFLHLLLFLSALEIVRAENVTVVSGILGESVVIQCPYSHEQDGWKRKIWCKHLTASYCEPIVSARRFWPQFMKRRNGTTSIADYVSEGILTVNITQLSRQDAGLYQCQTRLLGEVSTLKVVKLEVLDGFVLDSDSAEAQKSEVTKTERSTTSSSGSKHMLTVTSLVTGLLFCKLLVVLLIYAIFQKCWRRQEEHGHRDFSDDFL